VSSAEAWFTTGDVVRTVENTFLYDADYKDRNIDSLVIETVAKDSGGTPRAKTQISYDDSDRIVITGGSMPSQATGSWTDPLTDLGTVVGAKRGLPTKNKAFYDLSNGYYIQTDNLQGSRTVHFVLVQLRTVPSREQQEFLQLISRQN
jgi:hypothetical protein